MAPDAPIDTEENLRAAATTALAQTEPPHTAEWMYLRRAIIDLDLIRATIDLASAQLRTLIPPSPRGARNHHAVRLGVKRLNAEIEAEIEQAVSREL
ncbi:hypothetical protein TPB0596_20790 [Tsukamurella pulmonis]|uniref:hypothetical protein n=1 Tax=Tsukamurella pulmonis TaxID=47312 RepID=UPI001EDDB82E|nr:hypothetical protein [Tsukamurella pulmonis]BDD82316.1 hypothetical protein TPB0596_20790 [Tsukamurella pulmonis]